MVHESPPFLELQGSREPNPFSERSLQPKSGHGHASGSRHLPEKRCHHRGSRARIGSPSYQKRVSPKPSYPREPTNSLRRRSVEAAAQRHQAQHREGQRHEGNRREGQRHEQQHREPECHKGPGLHRSKGVYKSHSSRNFYEVGTTSKRKKSPRSQVSRKTKKSSRLHIANIPHVRRSSHSSSSGSSSSGSSSSGSSSSGSFSSGSSSPGSSSSGSSSSGSSSSGYSSSGFSSSGSSSSGSSSSGSSSSGSSSSGSSSASSRSSSSGSSAVSSASGPGPENSRLSEYSNRAGRKKVKGLQKENARSQNTKSNVTHSRKKRYSKKKVQTELRRLRHNLLGEKFGYTDESNPFGDSNLSTPFIWEKKRQLLKAAGKSVKKRPSEIFIDQTKDKIIEIESVKKRREQREEEEKTLQEQQAILARKREMEKYEEWKSKEDAFEREMARRRTEIRLKQSRETLIDHVIKLMRVADGETFDGSDLLETPPKQLFSNLSVDDLAEFLCSIKYQRDMCESAMENDEELFVKSLTFYDSTESYLPSKKLLSNHLKFWNSMLIVGTDALLYAKNKRKTDEVNASQRDIATGIAIQIYEDFDTILEKMTKPKLKDIERSVRLKIKEIQLDESSNEDVTYWETILGKIPYYKALAECTRVFNLAKQNFVKAAMSEQNFKQSSSVKLTISSQLDADTRTENSAEGGKTSNPAIVSGNDIISEKYTPPIIPFEKGQTLEKVPIDIGDFFARREELREATIKKLERAAKLAEEEKVSVASPSEDFGKILFDKFVLEAKQDMEEDEYIMTPLNEVHSLNQIGQENESEVKYQLSKPRFFNRVKTGYEWTKYNQTHYDRENPPPKAVQGYKFNIFYPNLLDKSKIPTWKLKSDESTDTVLIKFHAGPPYEDVIFRIINREWDINPRSGFKNSFDKGILQLYFNFKKYRYRR